MWGREAVEHRSLIHHYCLCVAEATCTRVLYLPAFVFSWAVWAESHTHFVSARFDSGRRPGSAERAVLPRTCGDLSIRDKSRLGFMQQNMTVVQDKCWGKRIHTSVGRNKDRQFKEAWGSIYCLFMGLRVIDQWGLGSTVMAVVMPDEPVFVSEKRQKPEHKRKDIETTHLHTEINAALFVL